MEIAMLWGAMALATLAARLGEGFLHMTHSRILLAAGAREQVPVLMRLYYFLSVILLPVALTEQILWAPRPVLPQTIVVGLALAGAALALRFWAIRSLGVHWSMRCLAIPGARAVNYGPYKYINHPEYLSRVLEAIGIGLAFSAWWTISAYLVVAALLGVIIIQTELRQLAEAADALTPVVDLHRSVE